MGATKIQLPAKTSIRISFIHNFFFCSIGQFSRTTYAGTFPFVTNIVHLLFMFRKPATYRPTTRTCLRNPTTHSCSLFPGPSLRCSSLRIYTIITTGNGASWWLISNSGPSLVAHVCVLIAWGAAVDGREGNSKSEVHDYDNWRRKEQSPLCIHPFIRVLNK